MQPLDDVGDNAAPMGSRPWCAAMRLSARVKIDDAKARVGSLKYALKSIRDGEYYKTLQDREGCDFATWEDFVQYTWPYGLGFNAAVADAIITEVDETRLIKTVAAEVMAKAEPAGKHGGPRKHGEQGDNITLDRGTSTSYLAARIKRDRPDIAAAVERGEFSSMRSAAIAAGIIKQKTAYDRLISAWRSASAAERAEFLEAIGHA